MLEPLILGNGYDNAELMFVSDYARKFDYTSGNCLSGYYKSKLGEYLKDNNYSVDQTYRTSIIKHYIKGLGVGNWKQDHKILENCVEIGELEPLDFYKRVLIDEINTIKPKIIVALGEYALQTLTGVAGITKYRGSALPLCADIAGRLVDINWQIKVLASYHPNVVHTQEEAVFLIRMDFKKAVDFVFEPNRQLDSRQIVIARNSVDALRYLENYPIEKYPEMTCDFETHLGFITCGAISFDGESGLCFPLIGADIDIMEKCRFAYLLSGLLQERNLVNQNINYDNHVGNRFGLWFNKIVWDTMLAQNVIAAEFPKNLGFLISIYTEMPYHKDEGKKFNPSKDSYDQLYNYCGKDAIGTFLVRLRQEQELKELDQLDFFRDFVMRLYFRYYRMETIGLPQDKNKKLELLGKYEGLRSIKYLELKSIVGQDIKVSAAQVGNFMESKGFPVLRHRVDSGFMVINTDVDSLKKMRIADPIEYKRCALPYEQAIRFLNLVLLIRRIDKVIEAINVGVHPDGRIRTSAKLAGTGTGRTAGGQTADNIPLWEEHTTKKDGTRMIINWKPLGHSFQTITKHGFIVEGEDDIDIEDGIIGKDLREMFAVDRDWILVEADGAQAEARVCDLLGEDYESLEEYKKFDKHCKVASMIFTNNFELNGHKVNYTYEDILRLSKKEKTAEGVFMRQIGKHAKHAKNNGMEAYEFAKRYLHTDNMKKSINLGKAILANIDRAYPRIEGVFHKQVEECLRSTRQLTSPRAYGNPSGRKRTFFKKIDKHYLNVAYSYLPQCTISDHTKAAILRIMDQVDNSKVYEVAENHDSFTTLVRRGYLRQYVKIAKVELERPIDFTMCSLPRDYELTIPAEFSIGRKNWGQMKEIKKIK